MTSAFVVAGTVLSAIVASVASLILTTPASAQGPNAIAVTFGLIIFVGCALIVGVCFCVVTLFLAALTMPPTLWFARAFMLPRPAVDYLCVQIALEQTNSLTSYGLFRGNTPEIFAVVGVAAGVAMGWLRYVVLKPAKPANSPLVQVG
ncbi:MAG: hypothetical protein WAU68_08730 [Vitreimonas sp.]